MKSSISCLYLLAKCCYFRDNTHTMPTVTTIKTVPYCVEDMYELVNRIEAYPDFLPWCDASIIHHRDEDAVKASLVIAAGGIKKSFTTHNLLQKNKMIEIRLVDGPFKHLEGFWRFDKEEEGCKISLDLEFEFSTRWLSMSLGPIFHQLTSSLVDAFYKRAQTLHGK